uniref:Uncharacterized protein n=1 Tax=Meloidogyne enterolobii TaxID=390850 RepID=A0A6V7XTB8_MELEN|nr:unnamed protein product [Meloidogyne enterolobii]
MLPNYLLQLLLNIHISKNNVTLQCEQKRKEFCEKRDNTRFCTLGQPASTIWHGIKLKTEYITEKHNSSHNISVFVTTISLSITKKKVSFSISKQ